eukprot:TRINITY_DN8962_c0_g1_i1.p1 TRINITY_DN8962_c0_g1~~TRINITY_DN8962_c0_g1_i1.p1  ORF type:complete len:431 (+),score=52.11 TRINITY_DN8962_c0_g1_i1:49-1341(+)
MIGASFSRVAARSGGILLASAKTFEPRLFRSFSLVSWKKSYENLQFDADLQYLVKDQVTMLKSLDFIVPVVKNNPENEFLHTRALEPEQMRWIVQHKYTCPTCQTRVGAHNDWNANNDTVRCPQCYTLIKITSPTTQQPLSGRIMPRAIDDSKFIKDANARYQKFLHAQRANPNVNFYLPQDIKFALHVHMLHPKSYIDTCQTMFGKTLDFEERNLHSNLAESAAKWRDYSGDTWNVVNMNLSHSSASQSRFICRFDENDLSHDKFLSEGEKLYKQFFYLMKIKEKDKMLVPTLQIDLFWHAHMRSPVKYETDCKRILGRILDHDDSVPNNLLEEHLEYTKALWLKTFNRNYPVNTPKKKQPNSPNGTCAGCALCSSSCGGTFAGGASCGSSCSSGVGASSCSGSSCSGSSCSGSSCSSCGSSCGGGCGS